MIVAVNQLTAGFQRIALETHLLKESLPNVVVGINITPSEASGKRSNDFISLLDHINMDPPVESLDIYSEEGQYTAFSYDTWRWTNNTEADSYGPFCEYMNGIKVNEKCLFYAYNVSNGQKLVNNLLFDHDVISLRSKDEQGNKHPLIYRGHVKGRTDIVVMNYESPGDISRHMVQFAVEIKTSQDMQQQDKLKRAINEACTQVLGLCVDNSNNSPCVILTDITSKYFVCYLKVHELSNNLQPKYKIIVQKCSNLKSAINLATIKCAVCISQDLCRPTTPENSQI